jgi:hypothetical protein
MKGREICDGTPRRGRRSALLESFSPRGSFSGGVKNPLRALQRVEVAYSEKTEMAIRRASPSILEGMWHEFY